jgi:F0F1-type ATP synthase membrane subunit c/vacuolar-type H+-ATPase subunit K
VSARRLPRWAAALAAVAAGGAAEAAAQCALCGVNADAADPSAGNRTLASAILVLLLPAVALFGGAFLVLWRYRGESR